MPKENERAHGLGELRAWYLDGLRPKLARAARAGSVSAGAALALDRRMRDLLDVQDRDLLDVQDDERRAA